MQPIETFFKEIDARWGRSSPTRIRLRIIGSTALMLQTDYERGTKDSDVLETEHLAEETKTRLLQLAGPDTELHEKHRLYIDIVSGGLPFLPQRPRCHERADLNATLRSLEIEVLDIVDVVVSKLKRLNTNDLSDIDAMIAKGFVAHDVLIERFQSAVDAFGGDARAEDLPRYVRNLHRVERDLLEVPETQIELPGWV